MTTNHTVDDFTIYNPEYHTAMLEALAVNLDVFNGASGGAITLGAEDVMGNYRKHTEFASRASIRHRNTSSVSGINDDYMTDVEKIEVKTNLGYTPMKMTVDSWRKKGMGAAEFSGLLGRDNARAKAKTFVQMAAGILANKLANVADLTNDISSDSDSTLSATALANGLAKFGDAANDVVCWVMHSKPYFDLVKNAIADKIYQEAGTVVYGGTPGTLGKPVVVTDASLESDDSPPKYTTLGLVPGALSLIQSESDIIWVTEITGEQNLAWRIQGEFAVNIAVRNLKWNVGDGGVNPDSTALYTHTNWEDVFTSQDKKLYPGVCIISS